MDPVLTFTWLNSPSSRHARFLTQSLDYRLEYYYCLLVQSQSSMSNPSGCGPLARRHSTRGEAGQGSRPVALSGCRQIGILVYCGLDDRRPDLEFFRTSFAPLFLQTYGRSRAEVLHPTLA